MHAIVVESLLFGLGLALESIMVALANGLQNANKGILRAVLLALLFAACHAIALMLGFALVKAFADNMEKIDAWLTWIAAAVLVFLGVKMIVEGVRQASGKTEKPAVTAIDYVIQSVAASFDAFAVGLTVSDYSAWSASACAAIIFGVIAVFYVIGFTVGKKFGPKLGCRAAILGGLVFIGIAAEVILSAII